MHSITIRNSIYIDAPPELVWDFTQDYDLRPLWDGSVVKATVIQRIPVRIIQIRAKGSLTATLKYKLDDRPRKTSLSMIDVRSPFIMGGGGSWNYEREGKGTQWTQTNTLILKPGALMNILRPLLDWQLNRITRTSMRRARNIIENASMDDSGVPWV